MFQRPKDEAFRRLSSRWRPRLPSGAIVHEIRVRVDADALFASGFIMFIMLSDEGEGLKAAACSRYASEALKAGCCGQTAPLYLLIDFELHHRIALHTLAILSCPAAIVRA